MSGMVDMSILSSVRLLLQGSLRYSTTFTPPMGSDPLLPQWGQTRCSPRNGDNVVNVHASTSLLALSATRSGNIARHARVWPGRGEAFKREREAPRPFRTDDKRNVRRSLRVNVFHRRQGEYCIRQHRNRRERETRNTICDETSCHLSSLYRCFS